MTHVVLMLVKLCQTDS